MQSLEYLIARRTASSDSESRTSVMSRIATVTVALAMAAMILTLAVVQGFRRQIYADLSGFGADVRIVDVATLSGTDKLIPLSRDMLQSVAAIDGVAWVAPYVVAEGMAKCGDNVVGLQLKGVGPTYNTEWWQSRLVEGALPDFGAEQRGRQMLLSRATASLLGIGVGDRVEMLFVEDNRPRRDAFRVVGLYHTGFEEMDRVVALCDERDVRREVAIADDRVSGYDVAIADGYQIGDVAAALDEEIFLQAGQDEGFVSTLAATLRMRHPVIFDWMQAHTVIARAVVIIMMVVLLFNMAAAMLIMVFDRIGMIGALKALGLRTAAIRRIFLYRAALIFVRGAVWGNLVGGVLALVQWQWQVIRLDPTGYMLSVLPIDIGWWWPWLNVGAFAVAIVVMLLPSVVVAGIQPERTLRYKL